MKEDPLLYIPSEYAGILFIAVQASSQKTPHYKSSL